MANKKLNLFLYFVNIFLGILACKIPPSEWCISEGNAKKCNVSTSNFFSNTIYLNYFTGSGTV